MNPLTPSSGSDDGVAATVAPWTRLMGATAALGNAWAEFKLALDAYRETK